jgi:PIN domain nuclease of toxin-antitoxin system
VFAAFGVFAGLSHKASVRGSVPTNPRTHEPFRDRANADPENEPVVSIASLWEIAIKRSLGKLSAPGDLPERISDEGFSRLTLSASQAWEARRVPVHHRDPFDRLLVAQALIERLPIITADPRFRPYGVDVRR